MNESFLFKIDTNIIAIVLFVLMTLSVRLGYWVGLKTPSVSASISYNTLVGSLFALFGLLLAFTFNMNNEKNNNRVNLVTEESNAIGTALLRVDLYPDSIGQDFRSDFKGYISNRILYFKAHRDLKLVNLALDSSTYYGKRIWKRTASLASVKELTFVNNQMVPAVNDMLDKATTRNQADNNHAPTSIIWMLLILSVTIAFVAGYIASDRKQIDLFLSIAFCLLSTVVIYFILDLDRPRRGVINLNQSNEVMNQLLKRSKGLKEPDDY